MLNNEQILLGEYQENENDKLEFKISIPNELGNEYMLLNPEITFEFSSEKDEQNNIDNKDKEKNKDVIERIKNNPQTGDKVNVAIIIFYISTVGLVIVMILDRKENKREKNL